MENITTLQKLIYGDRNSFFSTVKKEKDVQSNNIIVMDFLLQLNDKGYRISNMEDLFFLTEENITSLKEELELMWKELQVNGFIFRKSFANSIEQKEYTREDWKAMFAQYSLTYRVPLKDGITKEGLLAKATLEEFFKDVNNEKSIVYTDLKEFNIYFNFDISLKNLVKNILESKIVLREQQKQTLSNTPSKILEKAFKESNVVIKETEVLAISLLIGKVDLTDLFMDTDQIVRVISSNFLYQINENSKMERFVYEGKINNQVLKGKIIKIPTTVRKAIIKSLNAQNSEQITVERMFKYHGFWKKILTAARWTTDSKIEKSFPKFVNIKRKLYENDRSKTLNGRIEKAKKEGDYKTALIELSSNPGLMLRNLLEYLRYTEGTLIAKKINVKQIIEDRNEYFNDIYEEYSIKNTLSDILQSKMKEMKEEEELLKKEVSKKEKEKEKPKLDVRVSKVKIDAKDFISSNEFVEVLKKTNSKLLWHFLTLLKEEDIYLSRFNRNVQNTDISYSIALPPVDKEMAKIVKKQVKKTLYKIKQEDNKDLGKVYLDENLKNYNIQFSGRASTEISLSGSYLSPGSKIPFKDIVGEDKLIRLGVAWKGKESCDIDHSLNILTNGDGSQDVVFYGQPTYKNDIETIISSSGDVVTNSEDIYSVELIDIDIDAVKKAGLGNMITSLIQYSGKPLNEYEVLWFMNIIDKKDRIIPKQQVTMNVDQFQYAIQITEETKNMMGFYLNFEKDEIEVLNIPTNGQMLNNAITNKETFEKELENRPVLTKMYKALKKSIQKKQIVDNIEEADIIISDKKELDCNGVLLHPGRNLEDINNIIF